MANNYKESSVAGVKWTRSLGGHFSNPYQGIPSISFNEEELITFSDGSIIRQPYSALQGMGLTTTMANQAKEFDLINPLTGDVIGKSKYQDVFVILHSLYMSMVNERDNPPVISTPTVTQIPEPLVPAAPAPQPTTNQA